MPTKKRGEKTRGRTYPLPKWWRNLARDEITKKHKSQKAYAAELKIDPPYINKVLTNETPTLSLVERMCRTLELPLPFVVAATLEEALAIDEARRIHRIKRNIDVEFLGIMTGVTEEDLVDQTAEVEPVHANSTGRRGKPR